MKKSTLISLIALGVAIIGALIALVAFLKRSRCTLCEDFEGESLPDFSIDDEDFEIPSVTMDEPGCVRAAPVEAVDVAENAE